MKTIANVVFVLMRKYRSINPLFSLTLCDPTFYEHSIFFYKILCRHNLGDKVIRLPCAHIYHPCCITEWLAKHCTCPICRYELPTDDPSYEKERKIRMQKRRPRFARYELERMTMKSLIELCKKLKLDNAIIVASEKKDIIQSILESGRVECIVAPEPVEYQSIGILRGMSVGGLKRCMAKSGVFFYAKDVVEKEDMVQIFINSGRIVLTEEESIYGEEISEGYCRYFSSVSVPTCAREESQDFVGVKSNHAFQSASGLLSSEGTDQEVVNSVKFHPKVEKEVMEYTDIRENKKDAHKPKPEQNVIRSASEEGIKLSLTRNTVVAVGEETEGMTAYSPQVITSTAHNDYNNLSSHDFQSHGFNNTSVAGLREVAATLNLDLSDCIEKKEMADRILVAISRTSN